MSIIIALILIIGVALADNSASIAILYPYHESILPYLDKTAEDRAFWFVTGPNGEDWGIDWNKERLPFTKVMIHHTGGSAQETPEEMEAVNKERYVLRYASNDTDPYVEGLEPHSFHVIAGKETFLPYHYLIKEDGTIIPWLNSLVNNKGVWYINDVAWHAGNWTTNCESISVGLIGNYRMNYPTEEQLNSLKKLISKLRGYNPDLEVIPHKSLTGIDSSYEDWAKDL